MGLKSGQSSENLQIFKDIIEKWNGSTCNCRVRQSWPGFIIIIIIIITIIIIIIIVIISIIILSV